MGAMGHISYALDGIYRTAIRPLPVISMPVTNSPCLVGKKSTRLAISSDSVAYADQFIATNVVPALSPIEVTLSLYEVAPDMQFLAST